MLGLADADRPAIGTLHKDVDARHVAGSGARAIGVAKRADVDAGNHAAVLLPAMILRMVTCDSFTPRALRLSLIL